MRALAEGDPIGTGATRAESRSERPEDAVRERRPRVVIVGGGFGGLYAARGLARAPVDITIVDKNNYHLFRPMLYQVATGLLSSDEIAAPIRSILRKQDNVTVLMEEVVGVDTEAGLVRARHDAIPYDYLVLATSGPHSLPVSHRSTTPIVSAAAFSRRSSRPSASRRPGAAIEPRCASCSRSCRAAPTPSPI
jgi:NAD(P)H-nitrite reductase large subunit